MGYGDGVKSRQSPSDVSFQPNEKGSKVEADVAMCPLLSLFRREENRYGDTYLPYTLHSYPSTL